MKKLAYSLAFTCMLMAPGANAGLLNMPFSDHSVINRSFSDKAIVTRSEDAETFTFRFSAASTPDEESLQAAIARYKKIPGFRSLLLGPDNIVVLTTDKTILDEHLQKLLLSSTRMYGHLGFQINA